MITDFLGDGVDLFDSPAAPSRRRMSSPSTPLALFYVVEPGDTDGDTEDYLDFNVPLIRCNLNRGRYLEFLAPYWDGSSSRLQYLADVRERVEQINTALHWWKSNVRSSARAGTKERISTLVMEAGPVSTPLASALTHTHVAQLTDGQACATEILLKERDSAEAKGQEALEKYKEKCEQLVRITATSALQYTEKICML